MREELNAEDTAVVGDDRRSRIRESKRKVASSAHRAPDCHLENCVNCIDELRGLVSTGRVFVD